MLTPATNVPITAGDTHRVDFLEFDLATQESPTAVNNTNLVSPQPLGVRNGELAYGSTSLPTAAAIGCRRASEDDVRNKLSTFSGVFCPVCISMFSALLFLRVGFAVGQLGFLLTTIQLLMAYMIILLTVLSLCALCTNGAIAGGGVYYMISRTLGPEFGGSVGVLFVIANIFSCALYIRGLVDALWNAFELTDGFGGKFLHCVLISILILCLALLGGGMFAKTAIVALGVIIIAYSSFVFTMMTKGTTEITIPTENRYAYFIYNKSDPYAKPIVDFNQTLTATYTGISFTTFTQNFFSNYTIDYTTGQPTTFAVVFSLIFAGVTGLMAGANMSGELARPNIAIPRGTLQAVLVTLLTYMLTGLLLTLTCSRTLLQADYLVMNDINISSSLIMIGIFAATGFSSISNMLGASRVLTRLAHDRLFGVILQPATYQNKSGNPLVSVIVAWVGVVCVFTLGPMNRIAKLTSIFFLLSYMGVNIACAALELTSAPNFRPSFKIFSWQTCVAGVLSTVFMMLFIDASLSAVAICTLLIITVLLHYQAPMTGNGSISQALIFHQVRKYLLKLDARKEHIKFWRPQILLLVSRPSVSYMLMDFVNDLKKSGLFVIGNTRENDILQSADPLQHTSSYWLSLIDYLKIKAFVELTISPTIRSGIQQLVRLSGLGAMKPNTVILGMLEKEPAEPTLSEMNLLRNLKYSKIGRADVVEFFTTQDSDLSSAQRGARLNDVTYSDILNDVLHLNKNLCVARHFARFDREMALHHGKRYIDVWPLSIFKSTITAPPNGSVAACNEEETWDNSALFVLQMACILSMSRKWRASARLRVFVCVNNPIEAHAQEQQLHELLERLRIDAQCKLVSWESSATDNARPNAHTIVECPTSSLRATHEMVRRNSADTAVVFFRCPLPPALDASDGTKQQYVQALRILTQELPPTLLVHGLSSVISTAL